MRERDNLGGSNYLPTYSRQAVGISGNIAPNMSGFAFAQKSNNQFWEHVKTFAEGSTALAKTYHEVQEKRDIRDTQTLVHDTIRQRQVDIFATRNGKNADNVLEDEDTWQVKTREEIIKASGLSSEMAGAIWDQEATQYLDKVGAHMLQQNKVAEAESKFAAQMSAQHDLSQSKVGDFRSLAMYINNMKVMYGDDSQEYEKAASSGIDVAVDTWAALDPHGTVQWFNTNKEQLHKVLGKEFADVNNAMARVESRLLTAAQRAVAQQQSSILAAEKAQKAKNEKLMNESLTKFITGENVDIKGAMDHMLAQGADAETVASFQEAAINFTNHEIDANRLPEVKQADAAKSAVYDLMASNSLEATFTAIEMSNLSPENKELAKQQAVKIDKAQKEREDIVDEELFDEWETNLIAKSKNYDFNIDDEKLTALSLGFPLEKVNATFNNLTTIGVPGSETYQSLSNMAMSGTLDTALILEAARSNKITKAQMQALNKQHEDVQKIISAQVKPQWDIAKDYLQNAIAPSKGNMLGTNPKEVSNFIALESLLMKTVNETEGIQAKIKLLDISDPNSLVNQLAKSNQMSLTEKSQSMTGPMAFPPNIIDPRTSTTVSPRQPGESIADWKARTGA